MKKVWLQLLALMMVCALLCGTLAEPTDGIDPFSESIEGYSEAAVPELEEFEIGIEEESSGEVNEGGFSVAAPEAVVDESSNDVPKDAQEPPLNNGIGAEINGVYHPSGMHDFVDDKCGICGIELPELKIKYKGKDITKEYDATMNVTLSKSDFSIEDKFGMDVEIDKISGSYDKPDAGDRTVEVTVTLKGNDATLYGKQSLTIPAKIECKPLVITPTPSQKKTYGASDPMTFTGKVKGLLSGDKISGKLSREAGENVGKYPTINLELDINGFSLLVPSLYIKAYAKNLLTVGDEYQIDYNESGIRSCKSSNKKVIEVTSDGRLIARKVGKTKLTITTNDDKTATFTVKVIDPHVPHEVSFEQGKKATLPLGQTLQLSARIIPASAKQDYILESSKPAVASVDEHGLVTPHREGKAKITLKMWNGKKATITVKVVDPYKPTGVSIAQGKRYEMKVGQTLQLSAALAPATAQSALTWSSKKPKVASVDANGVVTAHRKGTAKITVKTANKKKATIVIKVGE